MPEPPEADARPPTPPDAPALEVAPVGDDELDFDPKHPDTVSNEGREALRPRPDGPPPDELFGSESPTRVLDEIGERRSRRALGGT